MENKYERTKILTNANFKRIIGIKRCTFEKMVEVLAVAFAKKHEKGGRKPKLSVENQLLLALEYWRQYGTFAELGFAYGVAESTAHDITVWVENVLVKSGEFALPGKKALIAEDNEIEIILVDVTESPIERPKKTKKILFGQKEKTHNKDSYCRKQSQRGDYRHLSSNGLNARFQDV